MHENADEIWKYQRYRLVYEYVDAPLLPPPLSLIYYIFLAVKWSSKKFIERKFIPKEDRSNGDQAIKGGLSIKAYFKR